MYVKYDNLPFEIQQTMLYYQEKQGNKKDETTFILCISADNYSGGFSWSNTDEGLAFWDKILAKGEITHYYSKLPDLKNLVVQCDTAEEYKLISLIAHKQGLKWTTGSIYIDKNNFNAYMEGIIIYFSTGTYSSIEYATISGCIANKASDLLKTTTVIVKERKITYNQCIKLIKAACSEWKINLLKEWMDYFLDQKDVIVSEELYKRMRNAATVDQAKIMEEVFGKDTLKCPYKDGELIFVKEPAGSTWILRYSNGQIDEDGTVRVYTLQKKAGKNTTTFGIHRPAKGISLPKY